MELLNKIETYLESGKKRTFAGAIEWPGWCRSGRGEEAALQALLAYGPRYEKVLQMEQIRLQAPEDLSAFEIKERLDGTATTDFGAPDIPPSGDARPVSLGDLERFETILKACWEAFDLTLSEAAGVELSKGPRGGGRDQEGILRHVLGADAAYLGRLGWKFKGNEGGDLQQELRRTRQEILRAVAAAARGELSAQGPRGGIRWTPRYFIRRVVWHVLDHAWEIEDRIL